MDRERLAAYVSGDLEPDETAAVEAALARDPALRAELARIRRLDAELAALPDVEPRPGFDVRLRSAVADELDRLPFDDVAARRASRTPSPSLRRLGIAAAAAAAVAVVGAGLAQLVTGGGDDETAGMAALDSAEEGAAGEMDAPEAAFAAPPSGPLVVAEGRAVTQDELGTVVADRELFGRLAGPLSETGDPTIVAEAFRDLFFVSTGRAGGTAAADRDATDGDDDAQADTEAAAPDEGRAAGVSAQLEVQGATPDELEDVRGCLPAVLESDTPVIPLYAEVLTFEGIPALLYVVASPDPATGGYDRAELWVVERDSCQVRFFSQA